MKLTLVRDYSTEPSKSGTVEFLQATLTLANTTSHVANGGCDLVSQVAGRWCRARVHWPTAQYLPQTPHSFVLVYWGLLPPSPPSHSLFSCPYPEPLTADCGYRSPQRSHTRPCSSPSKGCCRLPMHRITTLIFYIIYLKCSIFCTVNLQKKHSALFFLFLLVCTVYSLHASYEENKHFFRKKDSQI